MSAAQRQVAERAHKEWGTPAPVGRRPRRRLWVRVAAAVVVLAIVVMLVL